MTVIQEYRRNLKKGRLKATTVHDLLNTFVDDDTGMKMGDLLASETLQDRVGVTNSIEAQNPENLPDLVTILFQGNTQILKTIEILLSMATDTAQNSWLDRFAQTDYDTLLDEVEKERPELTTQSKRVAHLDNLYGGSTLVIGACVAALREKLLAYESGDLHIDTATEEEIQNTFGDIANAQDSEQLDANLQYNDWLTIGTIYEGLKAYEGGNFEKGDMLDFFLEENDPEDTELYMPLVAALSPGQRCGLPFVDLETLMEYAFTDESSWAEQAKKVTSGFAGKDTLSVYENIDRDLYKDDGTVALTDAAQRAQNIATIGTDGNQETESHVLATLTQICYVATTLCTVGALCTWRLSSATVHDATHYDSTEVLDYLYGEEFSFDEDVYNAIYNDNAYEIYAQEHAGSEALEAINGARFAIALNRIVVVVTLVVAVITAVLTVIDMLRDKVAEQLPIPKYMVDNITQQEGGNYTLNYKAVECNRTEYFGADYAVQTGNCADLLADEGKQWLALYASKNSKAGSGKPLTPDIVVKSDAKAPEGYDGNIHLFGEKGAVNTVGSAFKEYTGASKFYQSFTNRYKVYVFCKLSADIKSYDESAGNMTASAIGTGTWAIFGFGGLALGAVLGAVITVLVKKGKKKENA